jgi:phage host-nuclease inhibitor protein Gam
MADRLTLARALEEGGIGRDAAEHIATEIFDAVHEDVATKSDLQATETALRGETAAIRSELAAVRAELKQEIAALRAELKQEIAALRAELTLVEHRLVTRLGSMVVVATGILVAVHYIH